MTPPRFGRPVLAFAAILVAPLSARADDPVLTGEQIYKTMCVRCHGPAGEGTKKYPTPLAGDKSVAELAKVIDRTMPEDDPDKLDAVGSRKVAEYIHGAFYSADARARNKPPRIDLARLTVRQYRNAVADLVGGFRPAAKPDEKRGLRGEYFDARGFQPNKRQIDRIDPEVKFEFGTVGPNPDKPESFNPHIFSIRWEGSVLAPDTGMYEFVVRTEHATRLFVNDPKKPVIDAWVKSGNDTEYRASVFLLAGRSYPVRLEFSKAKQGVDDSKKNTNPPPVKASVSLLWKPPHRADEVIPTRFLSPAKAAEVFVCESPFPPDDRSLGWERGSAVTKEWDAATTEAAFEVAGYITARLPELAGVADNAPDRAAKLRDFCRKFTERAFRRPLTDEEKRVYVDRHFDGTDPELAVKRVVLFVLKSPRFLYTEVSGTPEQFAVASRLALILWDSLPDQALLDAAAAGKLGTREEVAKQAERMLADPRAKAKVRQFLLTWLKVDQPPDMAKDPKKFPGFDAAVTSDLRTSLELFLDDVVWGGAGDFRQLLLSEELFLNGRLAKFYGADLPPDAPFTKLKLDPAHRVGILTHPYLMSAFAYTAESSPIHRGVFLARGVLGISLRPPQDAFTPLPAELHPNLTTRERIALQTKPAACVGCHGLVNPLGFTLENFDAVGRYRENERGKPVDASGTYQTRSGETVTFAGPRDLAKFLAASPEVHASFAEQLFHHLVKQPVRAFGLTRPAELEKSFKENGFNVRKLVVEIAVTAATAKPETVPKPAPRSGG